jgi:DNA helicase-2/ATP-dependent DNA helicase PcrA
MYVAITRARKRLYLSHSQTRMLHGRRATTVPSRFWTSCPKNAQMAHAKQPGFGTFTPKFGGGSAYGNGFRAASGTRSSEVFANPVVPPQKTVPGHGITKGITVFHAKFGEGKVLAVEGTGDDAAPGQFPRHGTKWLALAIAKLTIVE